MTVSKTVYQGSNPCQPVLSLSGDRLGDLTKFEFSFHKPFGNCGLSITLQMQVYPTCLLSMRRKTMVIGDVFAGSSPATCAPNQS